MPATKYSASLRFFIKFDSSSSSSFFSGHMSATTAVAALSDVVLTDAQQVHKQVLSCEELSSKVAFELRRLFAVSNEVYHVE
jgi:hypothetical protein